MSCYIDEFADFLKNNSNLSKNTLLSYKRDVELFFAKMNIADDADCLKITGVMLQEYLDVMSGEGKADSTVLRSAASLRHFYGYLLSCGSINENPAEGLILPRREKKAPVILTPGEINKLLSLPKTSDNKGVRDKAMLELLYATGMKVSELIALELRDIDLSQGSVMCRSEGRERVIPMGAASEKAVGCYISDVRGEMVESKKVKTLFVNCQGRPMTRQGFWKIMKAYIEKAGIKKPVTPQTLRHSFAVHLLQNGADYRDVSEMLGYNDELSARVYSNMLKERLKRTYNRAHPRA